MENLGKVSGTTDASITNRMKEMEKTVSGVGETVEETDSSVTENVKSDEIPTQNFQKIWDTMNSPNLKNNRDRRRRKPAQKH